MSVDAQAEREQTLELRRVGPRRAHGHALEDLRPRLPQADRPVATSDRWPQPGVEAPPGQGYERRRQQLAIELGGVRPDEQRRALHGAESRRKPLPERAAALRHDVE